MTRKRILPLTIRPSKAFDPGVVAACSPEVADPGIRTIKGIPPHSKIFPLSWRGRKRVRPERVPQFCGRG